MKQRKKPIRRIVKLLNDPEEDGGFWLPNIQRRFVWSEEQICRLFDSILREYPIGALLVWRTKSPIRRRRFIENWYTGLHLRDMSVPADATKKYLVLDGQQRLQSLFIGLCGSYEGRELHLHMLSGEPTPPDDMRYQCRFLDPATASFPWIKLKELVFQNEKQREVVDDLKAKAGRELTNQELDILVDNINLIDRTFKMSDAVAFQQLSSVEDDSRYSEDDVVEIFIRANSGGTRLGKSDLLFSLLTANWDVADKEAEDFLESLNSYGFAFDRDFLLKTCLVLLGQRARYEVAKFRKPGIRERIESEWSRICGAIQEVLDYVRGNTFIRCDQALPTYLVLIPLVYLCFHYREAWRQSVRLDQYLLRSSFVGAFGGMPDTLLDGLVRRMDERQGFELDEWFDEIRSRGRSLELTEDRLWSLGYGSKAIHLLFNLWYGDFDYTPAFSNNLPQIDHIFPRSRLRDIKVVNPETGRKVMKYRQRDRDQLANCMLLSREENGPGGKGDQTPEEWFADKEEGYLAMHLIPRDSELWRMDRFEDFIEERKRLIRHRFAYLLTAPTPTSEGSPH